MAHAPPLPKTFSPQYPHNSKVADHMYVTFCEALPYYSTEKNSRTTQPFPTAQNHTRQLVYSPGPYHSALLYQNVYSRKGWICIPFVRCTTWHFKSNLIHRTSSNTCQPNELIIDTQNSTTPHSHQNWLG